MKVLLSNLDPVTVEVLDGWLRTKGHTPARCGAGEERLAANRSRPDIIIGCFPAPGALGDFSGWLRARQRLAGTRLLAVLSDGAQAAAWVRAGAADVILAPVSRGDFELRLGLLSEGGAFHRGEAARIETAEADRLGEEAKKLRARGGELEQTLEQARARLEETLAALAAERGRTAELSRAAGKVEALEAQVAELTARLGDESARRRVHEAAVAGQGAAAEALAKAHGELAGLKLQAEEARRLPRRLLEAIGGETAEGLLLIEGGAGSAAPTVAFANAVVQRMCGRSAAEIEGQPLWFTGREAGIDWTSSGPVRFEREEPGRNGGLRKLHVAGSALGPAGDGRWLWVMVFTEVISDIVRPADAPPAVAVTGGGKAVPAPGRRVLLARDSGPLNPRIAGVLRDAGFNVVVAEPGSGVVEKMQSGDFDLAVLEINRPGPQGPSLLRQIRQRLSGGGVMVVSRLLTLRQKQEVSRLGVGDVVTADLSGPELLGRIQGLTAGRVPGGAA